MAPEQFARMEADARKEIFARVQFPSLSSTAAAIQVIEFIRALALTWKNLSQYPPGHPALVTSLEAVDRCLRDLRGPAGEVIFGITPGGLVYGDLKIEVPAAQRFAQALYTRGVAMIRFAVETDTRDIETFLRLLAAGTRDPKRVIGDDLTAEGVININIQAVHYAGVQVTNTLTEQATEPQHSVWEEILRALMEHRDFAAARRGLPPLDSPEELARLIAQYADEPDPSDLTIDADANFGVRIPTLDAGEDSIHRFLERTVGQQIAEARGMKKQHSLEQALQLIRTLPEALRGTIIRAVIRALAFDETAAALLRDFADELPNDEVLDALRYLSMTDGLSPHATTLLQSLSTIAAATRTEAEAPSPTIVADLVRLFGEDDVNRFNPAEHRELLGAIALQIPNVPDEAVQSLEQLGLRAEVVAETMPQFTSVLFDLLAEFGSARTADPVLRRLESVFLSHIGAQHFADALTFIERLTQLARSSPETLRRSIDESLARLAAGEAIQKLIDGVHTSQPDMAQHIQGLTNVLGASAQRGLLVALAAEENRSRRRRLFDFVASFGPDIVTQVTPFLSDERWYVVRNMIVLLRTVQDRTTLGELQGLARHPDLRVRMEAIKSLFMFDATVPSSLLDDLFNDPDPKIADAAVALVGSYRIKEGVDPLLRILDGNDAFRARRSLRIKAIRALGEIADERALSQLDRFLKTSVLPWPSKDERYAVWETLHRYSPSARKPFVARGLRTSDPQVRAICAKLAVS